MAEKSYPKPVSFRLDESYGQRLREEAERYGMSTGEYARRLVLDALEDTERHQLREAIRELREQSARTTQETAQLREQSVRTASEVTQLRKDVARLREGLGKGVAALFVLVDEDMTKDQARTWVKNNIL